MNDDNLYASHGPVSSMPGSIDGVPPGTMCDVHPEIAAVKRVQGETDSFGAEYHMACQECLDKAREYREQERARPQCCDWCKTMQVDVRPYRDMDEGMAGPLYDVCPGCRKRDAERWAAEAAESDRYGDYDDYFDDDSGRDDEDDGFGDADEEPRRAIPQRLPTITYKKRRKILQR